MTDNDKYFLNVARNISNKSTCLRRKYGAVIVRDRRIISTGYNGSPVGIPDCCEIGTCNREGMRHNDTDYSMCNAVHAEMNAIISANPLSRIGATLYLYGQDINGMLPSAEPCNICLNLIRNSGIIKYKAYNNNKIITELIQEETCN